MLTLAGAMLRCGEQGPQQNEVRQSLSKGNSLRQRGEVSRASEIFAGIVGLFALRATMTLYCPGRWLSLCQSIHLRRVQGVNLGPALALLLMADPQGEIGHRAKAALKRCFRKYAGGTAQSFIPSLRSGNLVRSAVFKNWKCPTVAPSSVKRRSPFAISVPSKS